MRAPFYQWIVCRRMTARLWCRAIRLLQSGHGSFTDWIQQIVEQKKMRTLAGYAAAKTLNHGEKLGRLAVGAWADMIAVPQDGAADDPYETVVFSNKPINFSMVGGKMALS
ncbi:MAG: hypothetical protein ABSC38_05330 [Verrucomicrobiia bacterium]